MIFAEDVVAQVASESGRRVAVSLVVTVVTATLTFLLGRYWGLYKARREWNSKEFLDRVTVSLNLFDEGALKIRTIMERSLDEVFLNRVAVEKVRAAALACTPARPLLAIPQADRWYLLNFALNAVAEQFAAGLIRLDAGLPVVRVRYALFLTCEVVGDERIRKVRAMLVREDHLKAFPYPAELPRLENPWHATRIDTLRAAAAVYAAEPDQLLTLEVCV